MALVERALSEAELDLSFEALLALGRKNPQGLSVLSKTFFERICSQLEGSATEKNGGQGQSQGQR